MKILISDSAYGDLEAIKEYYLAEGVPHIGEKFVASIIKHIETLPDNPDPRPSVALAVSSCSGLRARARSPPR